MGKYQDIIFHDRTCPLCNTDIGDEYHYLLVCSKLMSVRKRYLKSQYLKHPNVLKFTNLMNTKNEEEIRKLNTFILFIMKEIK